MPYFLRDDRNDVELALLMFALRRNRSGGIGSCSKLPSTLAADAQDASIRFSLTTDDSLFEERVA